jgi:hexosaminidase
MLVILVTSLHTVFALWPAPRHYTTGNKIIKLDKSFFIECDGGFTAPADLRQAIEAAEAQLCNDNMVPLEVDLASVERDAKHSSYVLKSLTLSLQAIGHSQKCSKAQIMMQENSKVASISDSINLPFESRDESYTLVVPVDRQSASLTARTSLGLLRGLQTFTQLVYTTSDSKHLRYIRHAPFFIQDQPAFPVRGLLLDTARNYYPVRDIKRTLNAMTFSKMN